MGGTTSSPYNEVEGTDPYNMTKDAYTDGFLAKIMPSGRFGWTLVHYTYIGGASDDSITAIATRGYRVAFAGNTISLDYPKKGYAYQESTEGEQDIVVGLYDPTWPDSADDKLVYATYWGGELADSATGITFGADNRITVVGRTVSLTLNGATEGYSLQASNRGGVDSFLAQFDPYSTSIAGSFINATFLGGTSTDIVNGMATDEAGRVYLVGTTMSWDFPTAGNTYRDWINGPSDAFLIVLDMNKFHLDMLVYSTFFGGLATDSAQTVALDAQKRVWIAGVTRSDDLPVTRKVMQPAYAGGSDVFLARVNPWGQAASFVEYCSYLGGTGAEVPYGMAVDQATGMVTLVGYTTSADFPQLNVGNIPYKVLHQTDAFAARVDASAAAGEQLVWSTRYGGANADVATAVVLDSTGGAFIAGYTGSPDMPNFPVSKPSSPAYSSGMFLYIQ